MKYSKLKLTVWTSDAFNTNIEFTAISWMGVTSVMAWLIGFSSVWTDEAITDIGLIATVNMIGPNTDALLFVVGQAGRTFVSGCFTVPA